MVTKAGLLSRPCSIYAARAPSPAFPSVPPRLFVKNFQTKSVGDFARPRAPAEAVGLAVQGEHVQLVIVRRAGRVRGDQDDVAVFQRGARDPLAGQLAAPAPLD